MVKKSNFADSEHREALFVGEVGNGIRMLDSAGAIHRELTATRGNPPIIGGVIIHSLIGAGGMGAVFRGSHLRLRIPVAVKFLFSSDDDATAQFIDEATLAAKINHPNVVRVYDVNRDSNLQYIIQEYVDGQSAEQRLLDSVSTQKPLSEDFVLNLAADAARGLAALHAEQFLHLDIKPSNIMISNRDGVCKILDLGLSKRYETTIKAGAEKEKVAGGTPGYASPEQLQFMRVSPASDIYSLGITLFDLLAGRRINTANSWGSAIIQQSTNEVPDIRSIRPDVSESTAKLIERCVRIDASERFQGAMELLSHIAKASHERMSRVVRSPGTVMDRSGPIRPVSPTVFCVDDDIQFLGVVSEVLSGAGYKVETFTDGNAAIAKMLRLAPDVVLLDLEMPAMHGLEVCRQIRSNAILRGIPVVIVTGQSSPDRLNLAMHEGATDYLFKPVQSADLIARVRCLARITRAQRELESLEQQYGNFRKHLTTIVGKERG